MANELFLQLLAAASDPVAAEVLLSSTEPKVEIELHAPVSDSFVKHQAKKSAIRARGLAEAPLSTKALNALARSTSVKVRRTVAANKNASKETLTYLADWAVKKADTECLASLAATMDVYDYVALISSLQNARLLTQTLYAAGPTLVERVQHTKDPALYEAALTLPRFRNVVSLVQDIADGTVDAIVGDVLAHAADYYATLVDFLHATDRTTQVDATLIAAATKDLVGLETARGQARDLSAVKMATNVIPDTTASLLTRIPSAAFLGWAVLATTSPDVLRQALATASTLSPEAAVEVAELVLFRHVRLVAPKRSALSHRVHHLATAATDSSIVGYRGLPIDVVERVADIALTIFIAAEVEGRATGSPVSSPARTACSVLGEGVFPFSYSRFSAELRNKAHIAASYEPELGYTLHWIQGAYATTIAPGDISDVFEHCAKNNTPVPDAVRTTLCTGYPFTTSVLADELAGVLGGTLFLEPRALHYGRRRIEDRAHYIQRRLEQEFGTINDAYSVVYPLLADWDQSIEDLLDMVNALLGD